MVISYSHLVTVWKKVVRGKSNADITTVDKWLTYHVCLGHVIIDEGKRYCEKDARDNDLSGDNEMRATIWDIWDVVLTILTKMVSGGHPILTFANITVKRP